MPLVSLADHNKEKHEVYERSFDYPRLNGIACPECGEELWDTVPFILATAPPQRRIHCKKCGFSGLRYA